MEHIKEANIFNIQHFSVHDGPGVRTVVFFKGCNLHCKWCHNPESISSKPEIFFYPERCISCGACFQACPNKAHIAEEGNHRIDIKRCKSCFACCDRCYAEALVRVGEHRTCEKILNEIMRNKEYYRQSSGGVTFSGGECMLQPEALEVLLVGCQEEGIHTAVDTAGNVPWEYFEQIIPYTNLFLYDLKAMDKNVHEECTGVTNERIISNFIKLVERGCDIIVRIPKIPGYNEEQIPTILEFLNQYPMVKIEILPYHTMGDSKYKALVK